MVGQGRVVRMRDERPALPGRRFEVAVEVVDGEDLDVHEIAVAVAGLGPAVIGRPCVGRRGGGRRSVVRACRKSDGSESDRGEEREPSEEVAANGGHGVDSGRRGHRGQDGIGSSNGVAYRRGGRGDTFTIMRGIVAAGVSLVLAGCVSLSGLRDDHVVDGGADADVADSATPDTSLAPTVDGAVDGAVDAAADAAEAEAPVSGHRIFVTSTTFDGNLGGPTGANARCATAATTAHIKGMFKAILSDPGGDAKDRLSFVDTIYIVTTGHIPLTVAKDATELWGGKLENPISYDENENAVAQGAVWTGSAADGTLPGSCHCQLWTLATGQSNVGNCSYLQAGVFHSGGWAGNSAATNQEWALANWVNGATSYDCALQARLYCVEQR